MIGHVTFLFSNQLQERLPMDQFAATAPQLPLNFLDAAIPFPRTSGAKFCACGK
mgnify:CR=1 FL=1